MSALTFDKSELGNLEYSLQREMLSTDRIGGYMSTTIVCCNTRRYHGLIVAPIDDSGRTYLLLSSLDETVIQHDQTFNLALHRFPGVYEPRGHKYITDFEYTPTPTITINTAVPYINRFARRISFGSICLFTSPIVGFSYSFPK